MGRQSRKITQRCDMTIKLESQMHQQRAVEALEKAALMNEDSGLESILHIKIVSISMCLASLVSCLDVGGSTKLLDEPIIKKETISRMLFDMECAARFQEDVYPGFFSPIEYVESYLAHLVEYLSLSCASENIAYSAWERQKILASFNQLVGSILMFVGVVRCDPVLAKELFIRGLGGELNF